MTPQKSASWTDSMADLSQNPAENYERYFVPVIGEPMAVDLIEAARLQPGERVLDVACGTGIVTRMAAERVGPKGKVVGVDVNPAMLGVARAVAPRAAGIDWHQSSAESMPLPDASFDVVICQLGLQFVEDRDAALGEMHRVLAPGGRVWMNLPGPMSGLFGTVHPIFERHLGPAGAGFVAAVFSLSDPQEIGDLLRRAGFTDVSVQHEEKTLRLPRPEQFLWQYVGASPLATTVTEKSAAERAAFQKEVEAAWQEFVEGDGMRYRQGVSTATAIKRS